MINKVSISENVIEKIRMIGHHCNEGKLLGILDQQEEAVNLHIIKALPFGVPGIRPYEKLGTWGNDPLLAPAFPRPDEVFLHVSPETHTLYKVLSQGLEPIQNPEVMRTHSDLFHRVRGIFNTDVAFKKKVAIVGLGSVGSTIALELAKAGVGRFLLYDPDTLELGNVTRHVGDIWDLGRFKTKIIGRKILARNPQANIRTYEKNILTIHAKHFKRSWRDVDLIIAATDSQQATSHLNQISIDLGISLLWIGLYERASWGHVIFSIPGQTPCLTCVLPALAKIESQTPKEERIVDYSSITDASQIKAEPGLGTDIGFVAMAAAKVTLALLLRNDPASVIKHTLPSKRTLLIAATAPGAIFPETRAFQTAWVETSSRQDCESCQKEQFSLKTFGKSLPELQKDAQSLIDGLEDFGGETA